MQHKEKVDYFRKDLASRGIKKNWVSPPYCRMLWWLGINIPPPLFQNFLPRFFTAAITIFILMSLVLWASIGSWGSVQPMGAGLIAIAIGLQVSVTDSRKRKELGLPEWENYPEQE